MSMLQMIGSLPERSGATLVIVPHVGVTILTVIVWVSEESHILNRTSWTERFRTNTRTVTPLISVHSFVLECLNLKVRISLITLCAYPNHSHTYQETLTLPVYSLGFGPSCRTRHTKTRGEAEGIFILNQVSRS